jgi:hypothetical protein
VQSPDQIEEYNIRSKRVLFQRTYKEEVAEELVELRSPGFTASFDSTAKTC